MTTSLNSGPKYGDQVARANRVVRGDGVTTVLGGIQQTAPPSESSRKPIVLADFEGADYGGWTAEGEAFGAGPAGGTLQNQQRVTGFRGKRLVNTFLGGDAPQGTLTSPSGSLTTASLKASQTP